MKDSLQPGCTGEARRRVTSELLLTYQDPRLQPVLSTPWLLHIMEHAAFNAVAPHLDEGEQSVGVGFDFEHLAATPAGHTVVATAVVTSVDGKRVMLDFEARDDRELVGRGRHVRAVVDVERFRKRLKRKLDG